MQQQSVPPCASFAVPAALPHARAAAPRAQLSAAARSFAAMPLAFSTPRAMYPPIEPFDSGMMDVGDGHSMYYEQCGNPTGVPVVILHGGPGGGCNALMRQFYDAAHYRIVLFDQRGCGRSKPFACLENNTTWHLVADIEKLREKLGIDKWQVFGGSWGSTLALAYAETHPERVTALLLRGIFMLRKKEIDWFYQEGGNFIYPDAWEHYEAAIPEEERGDYVTAYHKRLTSTDKEVQMAAAKAWAVWEGTTSKLFPDPDFISKYEGDEFSLAFARIENHYFFNRGFFETDDFLLRNVDKIRHIPAVIVQGRYDIVCPITSAWDLHKAWPEADLQIIADAGHSAMETGITAALLDAGDKFRDLKL